MTDEDDPVVASYDVYLNQITPKTPQESGVEGKSTQNLFLLQYPAHRSAAKPYDTARSQKPKALRLKPETGLVELDIPILTDEYYNVEAGTRYGKALSESRIAQAGGTFGLAGGFNTGPRQPTNLKTTLPDNDLHQGELSMKTQTLGGKIIIPDERGPVYLVGSFDGNELHLSSLDALVQMRPQLHHLDAEEENNQKRFQSSSGTGDTKPKPAFESIAPKVESKPVEIKIKDARDEGKDSNLNENARLLMQIQMDQWRPHQWIEHGDAKTPAVSGSRTFFPIKNYDTSEAGAKDTMRLRSCISNGDWLDKMSAPREDGKKGLLAKLRGRERERARRKKAEEEKRQKQKEKSAEQAGLAIQPMQVSTESDTSSPEASESDTSEQEVQDPSFDRQDTEMIDITKAEELDTNGEAMASSPVATIPPADPEPDSTPKKRSRPRRSVNGETVLAGP